MKWKVHASLFSDRIPFAFDSKDLCGGLAHIEGQVNKKANNLSNSMSLRGPRTSCLAELAGLPRERLEGTLDEFTWKMEAPLGEKFMELAKGSGNVLLKDGKLKGFHLGKAVLNQMQRLPFVSGYILEKLPQSFDKYFEGEDTIISKLSANLKLERGAFIGEDLLLVSDVYSSKGRGVLDGARGMNLGIDFIVHKELAEALALKIKEIGRVIERDGTLHIPVAISGKLPSPSVVPNFEGLLKKAMQRVVEKKVEDFLGDVLGGSRGRSRDESRAGEQPTRNNRRSRESDQRPAPQGEVQEKEPIQELLEGLLRGGKRR